MSAALPTRVLGKTGAQVSVIGLGTGAFGFGKVSQADGVAIVRRALELGVTYFDTAHYYETELIVGEGLEGSRDRVFLATKTTKRNGRTAAEDLQLSLKQLRTDHVDLWLMHCVNTIADVDALVGPGGALQYALEAKREGLVRAIGMSGHTRPNVLAYAIERFPLDVVMPAMGMIDSIVTSPEKYLLPQAKDAGCGVVAMKVLGNAALAAESALAIRHSLALGADTAVVGVQSPAEVEKAVAAAAKLGPLTADENERLLALARKAVANREGLPFWLTDAQVLAFKPDWRGGIL